MENRTNITETLHSILEELKGLKNVQSSEKRLWDADDIANYLKLSKGSVQSRVVCSMSFPSPIRIKTGAGYINARWEPIEVKRWACKFRKNNR